MLHIVLAAKQPFRRELHSTVIEKIIWVDLGIVLIYAYVGKQEATSQFLLLSNNVLYIVSHTMNPVMYVPESSFGLKRWYQR